MKIPDSNRKICLLPRQLGLGGPASFQARLSAGLKERGVEVGFDALDPANGSILVVGGTRELLDLWRAKRWGVRIVQRLNGMNWVHRQRNTGIRHFVRAETGNWLLSTIRRRLADGIVYQSQFSRQWWNGSRGNLSKESTVIYNGVDLDQFSPAGVETPPSDHYRILLVEGHHGGGYDQGLLNAVKLVQLLNQRMDKPVELRVVGDVPVKLQAQCIESGIPLEWMGVVKRSAVPALDRSAHALFSTDINAACPNAVVEALACGLPVVSFDTGALPEMVTPEAGWIAKYGGDPWKLEPADIHALADGTQQVLARQADYRAGARARAEAVFGLKMMVDQYLDFLWK